MSGISPDHSLLRQKIQPGETYEGGAIDLDDINSIQMVTFCELPAPVAGPACTVQLLAAADVFDFVDGEILDTWTVRGDKTRFVKSINTPDRFCQFKITNDSTTQVATVTVTTTLDRLKDTVKIMGADPTGAQNQVRIDADGRVETRVVGGAGSVTIGAIEGTYTPFPVGDPEVKPVAVDSDGHLEARIIGVVPLPPGAALASLQVSTESKLEKVSDCVNTVDNELNVAHEALTRLQACIGVNGASGPWRGLSIAGTDSGGFLRELMLDNNGHLISAPPTTTTILNQSVPDNTLTYSTAYTPKEGGNLTFLINNTTLDTDTYEVYLGACDTENGTYLQITDGVQVSNGIDWDQTTIGNHKWMTLDIPLLMPFFKVYLIQSSGAPVTFTIKACS